MLLLLGWWWGLSGEEEEGRRVLRGAKWECLFIISTGVRPVSWSSARGEVSVWEGVSGSFLGRGRNGVFGGKDATKRGIVMHTHELCDMCVCHLVVSHLCRL